MDLKGVFVFATTIALISARAYQSANTVVPCFEQKGINLAWVEPFTIAGLVSGYVEGESKTATNYRSSPYNDLCFMGRVSLNATHFELLVDLWNENTESGLLLPGYVALVYFTVESHGSTTINLYGCSALYRVILQIDSAGSCEQAPNHRVVTHRMQRSEMQRWIRNSVGFRLGEPGRTLRPDVPRIILDQMESNNHKPKVTPKQWIVGFLVLINQIHDFHRGH